MHNLNFRMLLHREQVIRRHEAGEQGEETGHHTGAPTGRRRE
jgi:hypothetical protein